MSSFVAENRGLVSRLASLASGIALTIMLAACAAFGPGRTPPTMPTPAHYAAQATPAQLPAADGNAQQIDEGASAQASWWRQYQSEALDALVAEGLAHSPSLAAAQSSLKAAREGLRAQIGASLFPSVDAGFDPSRQRALGLPVFPQPTYLYDVFAGEVQASYTFDFFGASVLADRSLAHQVRAQIYQFEALRRALVTNIVEGTINVASLQSQLEATERLVNLSEQQAAQVAARYRLGGASQDDMLSAEQAAASEAAQLPALRSQLLAMRHAQAVLLGRAPDQAPEPLNLESLKLPATVPASVPSELLQQRPDILASEAALRAAAFLASATKATMFPTLTLSAAYGRGAFSWESLRSPSSEIWSVGAGLTEPIFHGGAIRARIRQNEALYDAAVSQYQQTVLAAFQNVADTLVSLDEDANTLTQAYRASHAAEQARDDTNARYQLGAVPYLTTLTSQAQFENANVQYIRARAARLADTAALFAAMGNPSRTKPSNAIAAIRP